MQKTVLLLLAHYYQVDKDTGQVVDHQTHISDAINENKNKVTKCIKHNVNGYTNWKRFRNRILYVSDPTKATFHLEEIEIDKIKNEENERRI